MTNLLISIAVLVLTFGSGFIGLLLQRILPEHHTSERSRDMIGAVVGLVTLMLALVLGTVVGFTYAAFSTQKSELETLATRYLQLDHALAQYGPETHAARARMKDTLIRSYDLFFVGGNADPEKLTVVAAEADVWVMDEFLTSLNPTTPPQKEEAEGRACDGQFERRTDRTNPTAVPSVGCQSGSLFAFDRRGGVVVVAVLWVRRAFPHQSDNPGRAGARSLCSGQRDIPDPRPERAL